MPNQREHNRQYQHNRSLLLTETFDLNSTSYYDWVITIAFYSALHLVDRELAAYWHPRKHKDRELILTKTLKHIAPEYKTLEIQSRRARYECANITKKDAERAIKLLEEIEKKIAN